MRKNGLFLMGWFVCAHSIAQTDFRDTKLANAPIDNNRAYRVFQDCGLKGMIEERQEECIAKFPTLTPKRFTEDRTGDTHLWYLVSRNKERQELWYDVSNKVFWTSPMGRGGFETAAESCRRTGEKFDENGAWSYPFTVPTRQQVIDSFAAGMGGVIGMGTCLSPRAQGSRPSRYWTRDRWDKGGDEVAPGARVYYLFCSVNRHRASFSAKVRFERGETAPESLCVFAFAKK